MKKLLHYMRQSSFVLIITIASAFLVTIIHESTTFAATKEPSGLTISPLRTEPEIAPGTVYTSELLLVNTTASNMTITMSSAQFGVVDENYDYSFNLTSELTGWVLFSPSSFLLTPGNEVDVTYTINVPIGAEPGGRYISLFATSQPSTVDGSGIKSQEQVASLLYITVTGDVTRYGKLVSLHNPWLVIGPTLWTTEIQDNGSTHFESDYSLTEETLFGKQVGYTSGSALILPNSIRLVTGNIPSIKVPGIYKIVYSIGLGDEPAANVTRYILYISSFDGILLLFVIVMGLGLGYRYYRRAKKRRNQTKN
jgi:hypothetical protein